MGVGGAGLQNSGAATTGGGFSSAFPRPPVGGTSTSPPPAAPPAQPPLGGTGGTGIISHPIGGLPGSSPPTPTGPTLAGLNAGNTAPSAPGSTPSGQSLLPDALTGAYQNASQTFGQLGTDALSLVPGSTSFMSGMFGPDMSPANQKYLDYSSGLGLLGMQNTQDKIQGMYGNAPYSSALAPAMMDAANQYALGMGQTGAGLANQQQQTAAGLATFPFQGAYQAATAGPTLQSQLFQTLQGERLGGLPQQTLSAYGSMPATAPAVVAGGKKG